MQYRIKPDCGPGRLRRESAVKRVPGEPRHHPDPKPSRPAVSGATPRSHPKPRQKSPAASQAPQPPAPNPPEPDPINDVEARIAAAHEALASAGQQLQSATGSLQTARRQRGEDRDALRGFRSLVSSIKKLATGAN